jgi:exopolysaccharide production protein ExoQ
VRTASATFPPNTAGLTAAREGVRAPLQLLAGFFFAFRGSITYLAFQSDARTGAFVSLSLSALLLAAALVYTLGDKHFTLRPLRTSITLRWLLLYLAVNGASVLWTAAESPAIAAGYWAGMAMDVATALLLIKPPSPIQQSEAIMKGFILGALVTAAIAWLAPTLPDLRIGNDPFLHPNAIGLLFALTTLLAQYLASRGLFWKLCAFALGLSLLRTLSKTSIIAFLVAEAFFLLRNNRLSRAAKVGIALAAMLITAAFWSLLEAYFTLYVGTSGSAETLTGRLPIWVASFAMALERPWIGHGLYSFRALIPTLDGFQPWHAHNELLQQFFEFGLLGVIVTAGLYISLFRMSRRNRTLPLPSLAATLCVFAVVHGLTDTVNFGLSLPLWLFAALGIVLLQPQPAEVAP